MDVSRIRVRRYPVAESQGLVFVWIAVDPRGDGEPTEPPPVFEGVVGGAPKLVDRMDFDAHIDHAVVGLMDPAHGPYVHQQWWWRSKAQPAREGQALRAARGRASPWSATSRRRTPAPTPSWAASP